MKDSLMQKLALRNCYYFATPPFVTCITRTAMQRQTSTYASYLLLLRHPTLRDMHNQNRDAATDEHVCHEHHWTKPLHFRV